MSLIKRIDAALSGGVPAVTAGDAPYLRRLTELGWTGGAPRLAVLRRAVVDVADELYTAETEPPSELLEFSDGAFDVMFDAAHERTVLIHGLSRSTPPKSRDDAYHRGFPARPGFDRAHGMAHAHGGREGGPNYFPQDPRVNQRGTATGNLWRDIETFLAAHPGIYCFVRMAYPPHGSTDVPQRVEYGVLVDDQFRVVVFPNA
ncbi:hypothetical protein AB0K00_09665 [Dactylosporangium sp. NPDC049525]|uniref:hypothetical protein n=1 Tax=Dactylosporangium sp. NPDC049525 TaxID=3154730 RepID=UPI003413D60E